MVRHPVDGRRGGHGVGEDALPLGEDQVGRDAQGPELVAFGDQGEEDLGLPVAPGSSTGPALGQVAQVVQEQEVEVVQLAQLSGPAHCLLSSITSRHCSSPLRCEHIAQRSPGRQRPVCQDEASGPCRLFRPVEGGPSTTA